MDEQYFDIKTTECEAIPRAIEAEKGNNEPGIKKRSEFEKDFERLIALLGYVMSKNYHSEHVNLFLNEYVLKLKKSNLVYNNKIFF